MAFVFIGLGGNMGDRAATIEAARVGLAQIRDTDLIRNAPIYATRALGGPPDQPEYYNSVSLVDTTLTPLELLAETQAVETSLGRDRSREVRWGPRSIDLDILLWADEIIEDSRLVIPHPRLAERGFVLKPLADLAQDLLHPVLDLTVRELLERIDLEHEGIRRVSL